MTLEEFYKATEGMPKDADIIIECEDGYTEAREIECYKNNKIYIVC